MFRLYSLVLLGVFQLCCSCSPTPPRAVVPESGGTKGKTPVMSKSSVSQKPESPEIAAFLEHLADTSVPFEQREADLTKVIAQADVPKLTAVVNSKGYFAPAAIAGLGGIDRPEIEPLLTATLDDADCRMVAAALLSLGHLRGSAAIERIATTMKSNRHRADGQEDVICAAGVAALAAINDSKGVPVLARELAETVGPHLGHDYGSKVVEAIATIGDPAGIQPLLTYAARLRQEATTHADNPMGQRYLNNLAEQAEKVAATIAKSAL